MDRISVVIPCLNEAATLDHLLTRLGSERPRPEIIVVDGGSGDGSADVARRHGAITLVTAAGRGRQLVLGVERAQEEILLLLHADSVFPSGGLAAIAESLARDETLVGGNFRLLFDGDSGFARWLTGFYAWIRSHGVYYGDSGVFLRHRVYREIGGLRSIALMEDFDLVRRLERAGPTVCLAEPALVTSSRRFEGRHPVAIVIGWLWIHALFYAGVSPERLAHLYDSGRTRKAAGPVM